MTPGGAELGLPLLALAHANGLGQTSAEVGEAPGAALGASPLKQTTNP